MADPLSLLINSFTALGAIFLSYLLIYLPEHRRKRKEMKTDMLLLLKKLFDLALRLEIEHKESRDHVVHHMIFLSEVRFAEEKIRMHIKIPPSSNPEEYEDILDEFIEDLKQMSFAFTKDKREVPYEDYANIIELYRFLQQVISGRW